MLKTEADPYQIRVAHAALLHGLLDRYRIAFGDSALRPVVRPDDLRTALDAPREQSGLTMHENMGQEVGPFLKEKLRLEPDSERTAYVGVTGMQVELLTEPPLRMAMRSVLGRASHDQVLDWLSHVDDVIIKDAEKLVRSLSLELYCGDEALNGQDAAAWLIERMPASADLTRALLSQFVPGKAFTLHDGFGVVGAVGKHRYVAYAPRLADLAPHARNLRDLGLLT